MFTPGMALPLPIVPAHWRNHVFRLSCSKGAFLFLLLILSLPIHAASVLASLSVSRPVIFGVGSTTGTVTLNATSTTTVTVALKSGDANVMVPVTVQVSAGSLSTNFTISTLNAYVAPTYVTISGAAGGWLQSAVVTGVPQVYSVSVQNLEAAPGNGCVLLSWNDLADGTYQGYNIYRMSIATEITLKATPQKMPLYGILSGANAIKLNATPQKAPLYAITGLTNGANYQYKVSVVDASGTESALSSVVSATPMATLGSLSWASPPATASGTLSLYASISSGTAIGSVLLIDGAIAGSGGAGDPNTSHRGKVETEIDTTGLANGAHTFQLIGYVGNNICATVPKSIQVTNDFSGFTLDEIFQQDQGDVVAIQTTLPSGTAQWTLQVINSGNTVIRSWQGTTASTQLAWDGTDGTGTVQADGDYVVQLTALDTQNHQKQTKGHVALVKGNPNALALIQKTSQNLNDDQTLANTIAAQLKVIQGNNPGFTYVVLPTTKNASRKTRIAIRNWMESTVTDFYLFGHGLAAGGGLPPVANWGGANFWGNTFPANSRINQDSQKAPELHIIVPNVTNGRQYNFAMMDCCGSAGDDGSSNPAHPADQTWANAFNIGSNINFASAFFGWDGATGLNTFSDGTSSNWLMWRQQYWIALAKGFNVYDAAQQATTHTTGAIGTINPWDGPSPNPGNYPDYRAQIFGDITTTLP